MAASLVIEDERGSYTRLVRHPHNGYYAGDFGSGSTAAPGGFRPTPRHQSWGQ